ncbi:MAG: DUF1732 domain-containing protein, partial [Rhodospirillaceae bacterium]
RADKPAPVVWAWEVKSVNARGLDVRLRLPSGYEELETPARKSVSRRFARGALTLSLSVTAENVGGQTAIDVPVLNALIELARSKARDLGPGVMGNTIAPARLAGLMALAQSRESQQRLDSAARSARNSVVMSGLDEALDTLAAARRQEGSHLRAVVAGHLEAIDRLRAEATGLAAAQPEALKARLSEQVAALLSSAPPLPEERLVQETALLALKHDIREELDRLAAHIAQARKLVDSGGPGGRAIDFMCEGFNRGAKKLFSKK